MTGSDVADCEGTVFEDADWEYTIEGTVCEEPVCEKAVCDDEGSFDGLFGTLPSVWKRIFNIENFGSTHDVVITIQ